MSALIFRAPYYIIINEGEKLGSVGGPSPGRAERFGPHLTTQLFKSETKYYKDGL